MNNIKLQPKGDLATIERTLAKVIRDNANPPSNKGRIPALGLLHNIGTQTEEAINDYKYIKELLTEVKLIEEIMISSITTSAVSKNLSAVEYNISIPEANNNKLYGSMLAVLADYYKNTYKIAEIIPDVLLKALFVQGSAPYLILPESSLDSMIGAATSLEDAAVVNNIISQTIGDDKSIITKGYLGKYKNTRDTFSFEAMDFGIQKTMPLEDAYLVGNKDLKTIVVDNYDILKRPALIDRFQEKRIASSVAASFGASLESTNETDKSTREKQRHELIARVFKSTKGSKLVDSIPVIHHTNNEEYGEPTNIQIPAGAVVPIHPPGDPKNPVGYLILLEEGGKPIDTSAYISYYKQQRNRKDSGGAVTAALRNAATAAGITQFQGSEIQDLETLADCYTSLFDQDIIRRYENSQGRTVELGGNKKDLGRIMLARLMKNQRTMVLFTPAELMVYYAFDYNDYGIGVSLIEQTKMLSVMRINTMLANAIAVQRNAIGTTTLNIKLAEDDMEPHKTIHEIVNEHMYNKSSGMNLLSTDPLTSIRQMQRSATQVAVSGNSRYPDTEVSITETNGQRAVIDEGFEDSQRRKWLMGFGMIPEMVDQSTSPEFAAQIYSQNAIFAKMIAGYKGELSALSTKHVKIHSMFSTKIRTELFDTIKENSKDIPEDFIQEHPELTGDALYNELLIDFISKITLTIPDLSSSTNQQVMDDFNAKRQLVEVTVKEFLSVDTISEEILGVLTDRGISIDAFEKRLVSSIMRGYIRENNLSPQLVEMGIKEDGSYLTEVFEEILSHEGSVRNTLLEFILEQTKNIDTFNAGAEKQISKLEEKVGPIVTGEEVTGDGSTDDYSGGDSAPETDEGDDDWSKAGFGETEETPDENPEDEDELPESTPADETPPTEDDQDNSPEDTGTQ